MQDIVDARVKNAESTRTEEDSMLRDTTTQMIDTGRLAYVTILAVQHEVGISRGTLRKYPTYLGIESFCFHIGTRSLYISREAMAQVKQLKQNPALLAHCSSPVLPRESSERKLASDGR